VNLSTGSGAPSSGTTGDMYLDYSTGEFYTKLSSGWEKLPRLSNANTYTASPQTLTGTFPRWLFNESDQGADLKYWRLGADSQQFFIQTLDDALAVVLKTVFNATRAGAVTIPSSLTAGSGGVTIVDTSGKIPAISSTYFASLDGSNLTGSPTFTNLTATTLTLASNTVAQSGGNDTWEQYRGTNPQRMNWYNTRTSGTDREYAYAWWNSNIFRFGTDAGSGGGTDRNMEFEPGGTLSMRLVASDQTVNVASHLNPITNLTSRLGDSAHKYSLLYAGEMVVGTIVAQQTVATIGGRIIVAPTNLLTAALAAAGTTITVKYNNLSNGDRIYMESGGNVEWMAVTSGAGGSAGVYTYTVTRNLDGTGANDWTAGDAIVDTGTTGNGYIELMSTSGVLSGVGPTIVGNVRTGTTYSNVAPRWAIGNLDTLYGYSGSTYGVAMGDASNTNITIDATNGFRIRSGTTDKMKADTSGNLSLTGDFAMSTSGVFRAGKTACATGTGWWLDYNAGTPRFCVGDPSGNRVAWDGTDLTVRAANVTIGANGIFIVNTGTAFTTASAYAFTFTTADVGMSAYFDGSSKYILDIRNQWTGAGTSNRTVALAANDGAHTTELALTSNGSTAAAAFSGNSWDFGAATITSTGTTITMTNASANLVVQTAGGGIVTSVQPGFAGTTSNHDFAQLANNATVSTLCKGGGVKVGAATGGTGGCMGAGTLNVATGVYLNGVAYTNPEPLLQNMQAVIAGLESRIVALELQLQKGGVQ
jgi:hypothetical protein